jgi:hypothetical protein
MVNCERFYEVSYIELDLAGYTRSELTGFVTLNNRCSRKFNAHRTSHRWDELLASYIVKCQ